MPDTPSAPLGIPDALWDVLACPCPQHAPVAPDLATGSIVCTRCRTSFEVRDGCPSCCSTRPWRVRRASVPT